MNAIYCQTNLLNRAVWGQHVKLGFKQTGTKEVTVGTEGDVNVTAVVQEITAMKSSGISITRRLLS